MTYSAAAVAPFQSVYVVKGGHKQIKIGISINVQKRLSGIQTGCPNRVKLIGQWRTPHASKVEKVAHKALVRYRTAGEWFYMPVEVAVAVVNTLVSANPRSTHLPSIGPLPSVVFCWTCSHHKVTTINRDKPTSFCCSKCGRRDCVHVIDF